MQTQEQYQTAIEELVEKRKKLLSEVVEMTLQEFDEDELLDVAWGAYECLENVRKLRAEMRTKFPKKCNCHCHKEEETV